MERNEDIAAIAEALGCTLASADAVHALGRVRAMPARTSIAAQGHAAEASWLILDGAVRCEVLSPDGRMTVVATHAPGEIIGHFGQGRAGAAGMLTSVGATRLLAIPDGALDQLARRDADFALAIARCFARQTDRLLHRLAARVSLTAAGRIHARLLELADPDQVITPAPVVAALAISVQTTRETASRTISVLDRRGILRREPGRWIIQSPRLLEEMVV